jgi:helicase
LTSAQESAVRNGLFDRKSLLVNAPTNTGKTFIGELAALNASRQIDPKRSFFLVPLKALSEQMFRDLIEKYEKWGLRVAISTSDHYEYDNELTEFDVTISTYEKLNALLIKKPEITKDLGLVVVDEIQHIGDSQRGISLEMLLTRLMFFNPDVQIIGLSATISNAEALASWLNCILVNIDKRDVELREGVLYTGSDPIKFEGFTLNKGDFLYKEFNSGKIAVEKALKLDSVPRIIKQSETEQCLVFVNTQGRAESTAQQISRDMPKRTDMDKLIEEIDVSVEATPITAKLKKVLIKGVAFHHAGLLSDERRIVESGFRKGKIRVICSTPTLSAGVNTPAKNVIILFHEYYDGTRISVSTYKNISGRAGRLRKEDFGRSLLLAPNERDLEFLWNNYINAKPERVISQIAKTKGLDCSILGLISSKTCSLLDDLVLCIENTFYGFLISKQKPDAFKKVISKTLEQEVDSLLKMGLIEENGKLVTTELGLRCAEELLSPETTVFLYKALQANEAKIQKEVILEKMVSGIIHLCCCTNDAHRLFRPRSTTEIQELEAIYEVSVDSYFVRPSDESVFITSLRTTRMLLRWIEGVPYFDLSQYAPPGIINRMAENIQWILRGMARIAKKPLFNFKNDFIDFLFELSERVYFGVPSEALPIMRLRIQGIHRRRALSLAKDGYNNIDSLLEAEIEDLKKVSDIGDILALRIKENIEQFIKNKSQRKKAVQVRSAVKMGKNTDLVLGFYDTHGDDLSRHIVRVFKEEFKIDASFLGEKDQHEPDIIVQTETGNIAIEVKRREKRRVSAIEAEEILGKGAKYKPIAHVTIGYPDFVDVAKQNAISSKVTLIPAPILSEMLIRFWEGRIKAKEILDLLKSGKPIYDMDPNYLRQE